MILVFKRVLIEVINSFGKQEYINKLTSSINYAKNNFSEDSVVNSTFNIYKVLRN